MLDLKGRLHCPEPTNYCKRMKGETHCRKNCFGRGECIDNVCHCVDGWTNYNCAYREYQDNCARCDTPETPFNTTCYGDNCVCRPDNTTCMVRLKLFSLLRLIVSPQAYKGKALHWNY